MVEDEDAVKAIRHLTENFGEQAEEYPLVITRPEFKKFKVLYQKHTFIHLYVCSLFFAHKNGCCNVDSKKSSYKYGLFHFLPSFYQFFKCVFFLMCVMFIICFLGKLHFVHFTTDQSFTT